VVRLDQARPAGSRGHGSVTRSACPASAAASLAPVPSPRAGSGQGRAACSHALHYSRPGARRALARPSSLSKSQLHSLENLRGIPKGINGETHLSQIRKLWNRFYKTHPNPTLEQLLDQATKIDDMLGHLFDPPLR